MIYDIAKIAPQKIPEKYLFLGGEASSTAVEVHKALGCGFSRCGIGAKNIEITSNKRDSANAMTSS